MKKSINFKLKPGNDEIKKISKKGCRFLRANGFSDDVVQTQMLILRGLIARGKKFNDLRSVKTEMTIYLLIEKNSVTVEVRKPVAESSLNNLNDLDRTIQLIRGYQDPFEPYIMARQKASAKSSSDHANDLELARIAYETGAVIDFYVNEDSILNLSAVRSLT